MNQRFTLDRRSFEQFLAALSLVQQLKRQSGYERVGQGETQPFLSLLQLQRAITSGTLDLGSVMTNVVKLTQSVAAANAAGIWLFRNADEFSCCAQAGSIDHPDRLGADILAQLAGSDASDFNSCSFSPTLRRASHYPGSPNSVAIAPIRVHEKVLGAVAAFSSEFEAFSGRDLNNLQFLANLFEQALHRAMQQGYRDAVALEHASLLHLLQKIASQAKEGESQLSAPQLTVDREDKQVSSPEPAFYRTLEQPELFAGDGGEAAEVPPQIESNAADMSVPGVGVRAALGDVREFSGDESPSFAWEMACDGSARLQRLVAASLLATRRAVSVTAVRMRNAVSAERLHRTKLQPAPIALAGIRSATARAGSRIRQISHWRLRVRLVGLERLRPANWLHSDAQWPGSLWSRPSQVARSLAARSRTRLDNAEQRLTYLLRLINIQLRSWRREFRQARANFSGAVAQQKIRVRIAQRRQTTRLTNSAELTGEALQHAGESLADIASSAGQSTITALSMLKVRAARVKPPAFNQRALRRSAGAITVLAVMTIFVGLQAGVRHSQGHVNAASAPSVTTATPPTASSAAVKRVADPRPGPSSHLEITDTSVADTLHDLTRYEIMTLQRAAEYGDDDAAFQLGMAYETGYYLRQNCEKAAHWVKVAAESGNPGAAYNLALRYRTGDGLQADESAAAHWLAKASAQRYSPAKLAVASVH